VRRILETVARIFSPARLVAAGLVLLGVALVLYLVPSDKYVLLPDRARPVAPAVTVPGEKDDHDGGGIYYVAVEVKKASVLEKLFPQIHEGATLLPASDVIPKGESEKQHRTAELRQMADSQEIAGAVALRALGMRVVVRSPGTIITEVARDGPAAGKLRPQDLVVAVDGHHSPFLPDLRRLIRRHRPGEPVKLTVRRGDQLLNVRVRTIKDPHNPKHPVIGVFTNCALQVYSKITLPLPVHIDLGQVGGPSAGLAFALDVFEETGHDIDHGNKVAATGELCIDGTVVPVGGLKQKTIGAKRAGVDVFLVPAGENAKDAKRYAGGMRVIPVNSFRQALHALATLPKKRRVA
jgi:PDZ domain-containing protein